MFLPAGEGSWPNSPGTNQGWPRGYRARSLRAAVVAAWVIEPVHVQRSRPPFGNGRRPRRQRGRGGGGMRTFVVHIQIYGAERCCPEREQQ